MNYFTSYFKCWFRHGVRLTTSKQLISDILTSPKITTRTQRVRFLIWTVRFEFAAWYSDVDYLPLIKGCNGRRTNQIPDYQLHSFHLWNPWKHVDHSSVCPWQKPAKKVLQRFRSLPCRIWCADSQAQDLDLVTLFVVQVMKL